MRLPTIGTVGLGYLVDLINVRRLVSQAAGALILSVVLAGCGRNDPPADAASAGGTKSNLPSLAASPDSSARGETLPPPPGTPAPQSSSTAEAPSVRGIVLNDDGIEIGLAQINEALKVFTRDTERFPNSLDEMVKLRVINRIPQPPVGKKYALDQKTKTAVLVND